MDFSKSVAKATLRQFKGLPTNIVCVTGKEDIFSAKKTIPYGFILTTEVDSDILKLCKEIVGLTPEQMNTSFHKSWSKIKNTSQEQLWLEQIMHYLTTYGFKSMGIYNESTVFIPHEKLKIPNLKDKNVFLTVVKGLTDIELKEKVITLLNTGIALKEETVQDFLTILKYTGFTRSELSRVRNKEMMVLLCDELEILPKFPVELLRYIIYSITGKTLLIKDRVTIEAIKADTSNVVYKIFKKANLPDLATIFNRFKPIFMSFKSDARLIPYVNKISKLSKKFHTPLPVDYLNTVTSLNTINYKQLKFELSQVNVFRKIRLLYALNIRLQNVSGLVYKIRNGKSFVKSSELISKSQKQIYRISYDLTLASIVENLKVRGLKIHIPKGINYALPATEKQFTGEFPSGTSITVKSDMVVGIHWEDFLGNVDLDLSTISMHGKVGWNSVHKDEGCDVLFSGDMTDSSHGASELFYISKKVMDPLLLVNSLYSGEKGAPFKLFVAKQKMEYVPKNCMVDPNNIIFKTNSDMKYSQKILGIIMPTKKGKLRFILSESSVSKHIASSDENSTITRDYLYEFFTSAIMLKDLLKDAGAKLVSKYKCELDLSPESVTKSDFINLLK